MLSCDRKVAVTDNALCRRQQHSGRPPQICIKYRPYQMKKTIYQNNHLCKYEIGPSRTTYIKGNNSFGDIQQKMLNNFKTYLCHIRGSFE